VPFTCTIGSRRNSGRPKKASKFSENVRPASRRPGKNLRKARWYIKALKQSEKAIKEGGRELDRAYAELGYAPETVTQKHLSLFQLWRSEALKLAKKHKLESEQKEIHKIGNDYDPFYWNREARSSFRTGDAERGNAILAWWIQHGQFFDVAEIHKQLSHPDRAIEYYEKASDDHREALETGRGGDASVACDALEKAIKAAESAENGAKVDHLNHKLIDLLVWCGDSQMKQSDLVYGDEGSYFYNQAQMLYEKAARLAERRGYIDRAITIYQEKTRVSRKKIERLKKEKDDSGGLGERETPPSSNPASPWRCARCGRVIAIKEQICPQCGCAKFKYKGHE